MTWVKGQSGNPRGARPRKQTTADILRCIAELTYPGTEFTYRERAARVLWEQACKGNLQALQWITERTEGKVPDVAHVQQSLAMRGEVEHRYRLPDDQLDAVLAHYAGSGGALPRPS